MKLNHVQKWCWLSKQFEWCNVVVVEQLVCILLRVELVLVLVELDGIHGVPLRDELVLVELGGILGVPLRDELELGLVELVYIRGVLLHDELVLVELDRIRDVPLRGVGLVLGLVEVGDILLGVLLHDELELELEHMEYILPLPQAK